LSAGFCEGERAIGGGDIVGFDDDGTGMSLTHQVYLSSLTITLRGENTKTTLTKLDPHLYTSGL